jgi:hypothetical protein
MTENGNHAQGTYWSPTRTMGNRIDANDNVKTSRKGLVETRLRNGEKSYLSYIYDIGLIPQSILVERN